MAQFTLCASTIPWIGHQMYGKVRKNLHKMEAVCKYLDRKRSNLSGEYCGKGLFYQNLPLVLTVSGTKEV